MNFIGEFVEITTNNSINDGGKKSQPPLDTAKNFVSGSEWRNVAIPLTLK